MNAIILLSEVTDDVINTKYKADNLISEYDNNFKYGSINHVLKKVI